MRESVENKSVYLALDFLNPWCWIALSRLEIAINELGTETKIQFLPCSAFRSEAAAGTSYEDYLKRRLGDQLINYNVIVNDELAKLGICKNVQRAKQIPKFLNAFARLLWLQERGVCARYFIEYIFYSFYVSGDQIDDSAVLNKILDLEIADCKDVEKFRGSTSFLDSLKVHESYAREWSGHLVPSYRIYGKTIYGAQTPLILKRYLQRL